MDAIKPCLLLYGGEGKKKEKERKKKKPKTTTQQTLKFKVHEHWKEPEIGNSTHRGVGKKNNQLPEIYLYFLS